MKYLLISDEYRPTIGGIARVACALADGLVERNHDVTVLTNGSRKAINDFGDEKAKMEYYHRPRNAALGKVYLCSLWPMVNGRWIRRQRFDRILVIDASNALPFPIMTKMGAIEYEVLLHGSELIRYSRNATTDRLMRLALGNAKRIFSTTRFVESQLKSKYGHDSIRTSCGVGDNFIQNHADPEKQRELRSRYGFDANDFVIGTISRLDERKGNDLVIDAVAALATKYPNLKYLIGGTGPQRAFLENRVKELGVSDHVVFAGRVSESEHVCHYDLLNLYVMPNRLLKNNTVEGFGISFAEAATRGVASIGVDNGGVGEAIADGVSGVLLNNADIGPLTNTIEEILNHRRIFDSDRIRQHGRQFTWQRFIDRMVEPCQDQSIASREV
ncbi:GDP-mannose-dependent alpha-(1-6)-phosphatidylinositol monomannoside mannosyltransferase [Novipirellula aureliae]|uniref:GDP-mannose-dependent alpha-(1-6)-phosphatidylinositol monomannoside mannosyltransferase n=1 Tax=Novipirellula aureliae TaxID=2527966 RepID=A0A5C6E8Y5_9BACT|nr:glycosyltransferase family 4 protein [Novipirellula aureliae]TWU43926.1 GDP-mannose-dependent alpha-(1-6)-phosphatidylinositol monomannoside mannosyltransferase [Novipirellula aureliae]